MSTMIAAAATDVGKVRDHNEDRHLVDAEAQVFVVADGMGGHAAGEVASAAAVRMVRDRWTGPVVRRCIADFAAEGDAKARRALVHAVRQGAITRTSRSCGRPRRTRTRAGWAPRSPASWWPGQRGLRPRGRQSRLPGPRQHRHAAQ